MNKIKSNKTPKHLVKRGKKGFGLKSFSLAAIAGLTLFGMQASAETISDNIIEDGRVRVNAPQGTITGAAADFVEEYQATGERTYNFESADDVYTLQTDLGVMGEGSFTINGVTSDDGTKSTIDLNGKKGFKVNETNIFNANNLEIKNAISTDGLGGAIQFNASGLQELGNNLTFDNNKSQRGGAIYNAIDTLNIGDNAEFKGGTSYEGGAIFTLGGTLSIGDYLNVSNNTATGEINQDGTPVQADINAGLGGGLFITAGADVTIGDNAKFENNTAKHYGGAIAALDANSLEIGDNAIFKGNSAGSQTSQSGSAIYAKNTNSITIGDNAVFESNFGGAVSVSDAHILKLGDNVTLKNNTNGFSAQNVGAVEIGDNFKSDGNGGRDIYMSFGSNYPASLYIGKNAEISNKQNNDYGIVSFYTRTLTINDYFKYHNNNSGITVWYNTDSSDANKTFTIGNNAEFYNNNTYDLFDIENHGYTHFGNNLKIHDNNIRDSIMQLCFAWSPYKELTFGNDVSITNNDVSGMGIHTYYSVNKVILGDNFNISNNNFGNDALYLSTRNYTGPDDKISIGDGFTMEHNNESGSYLAHLESYILDIGDNAKINYNSNGSLVLSTYGDNAKVNIGDNFEYIGNDASSNGISIYGTFTLGDNATIKDNIGKSSYLIYRSGGSNTDFYIGDNYTYTNNFGGMSIYATKNFHIGDNANLSNNIIPSSGIIYDVYDVDIFEIGNNAKINNNQGSSCRSIEAYFNGDNKTFKIGNDFEMIGNKYTQGHGIYIDRVKEALIGDNATIKDNIYENSNYSSYMLYASGNSSNYDSYKFKIGDKLNLSNNKTGSSNIYMSYFDSVEFGDNTTLDNNIVSNENPYSSDRNSLYYFYNINNLTFGDNTSISNNTNACSASPTIYAENLNKLHIGDDFRYINNANAKFSVGFNSSNTDNEFILGNNANISNNTNSLWNLINAYGLNIFKIGDNLKYTDNGNISTMYASFINCANNVFSIGNNATISNNQNDSGDLIYASNVNKYTIGDNLTYTGNQNRSNIWTSFNSSNTDNEFTIGNNATISNNMNNSTDLIYASNVNKFTIGNNLTYTDNQNRSNIWISFNSSNTDNEFTIGNNATISNNMNTYSGGLIYADNLNKFTIGDNLTYTDNKAPYSNIYASFNSSNTNNEFLLGNNATISNNTNNNSNGLIYADNLNKFTIGDNLTYTDNQMPYSGISAGFNTNSPDREFVIGDNANISNNFNVNSHLINTYGLNKFILGDNLKVNNNWGGHALYASFSNNADNIYKIGDNFEMIGNVASYNAPSSNAGICALSSKAMQIGDSATIKDNINLGYRMMYANGNSATKDTNTFKIGDNFTYDNNQTAYEGLAINSFNTVEFGNDAIFSNNTANSLNSVISTSGVNNFKFGDNTKFVNNLTRSGSGAVYMSMDDNLIANFGKNTLFEGNEANGNFGGAIFFGGKELTFADNAQFINNTANQSRG